MPMTEDFDSDSDQKNLTGMIVGIVIGVLVFVAIIVFLIILFILKRRTSLTDVVSDKTNKKMRTEFNVETINYYDDNLDPISLNLDSNIDTNDNFPFIDSDDEANAMMFNFEEE